MDTDFEQDIDEIVPSHEPILSEEGTEYFECQKCGEFNLLKAKSGNRRFKKVRHIRLDDVTWGSLKRFAAINGTGLNNAIMLLLFNARTNNINYVLNERQLVGKANVSKARSAK